MLTPSIFQLPLSIWWWTLDVSFYASIHAPPAHHGRVCRCHICWQPVRGLHTRKQKPAWVQAEAAQSPWSPVLPGGWISCCSIVTPQRKVPAVELRLCARRRSSPLLSPSLPAPIFPHIISFFKVMPSLSMRQPHLDRRQSNLELAHLVLVSTAGQKRNCRLHNQSCWGLFS